MSNNAREFGGGWDNQPLRGERGVHVESERVLGSERVLALDSVRHMRAGSVVHDGSRSEERHVAESGMLGMSGTHWNGPGVIFHWT